MILHFGRKSDSEGAEALRRVRRKRRVRHACLVGTTTFCLAFIAAPAFASADPAGASAPGQLLQQSGGAVVGASNAGTAPVASSGSDAEGASAGAGADGHAAANASASTDKANEDSGMAAQVGAWIAINNQGAVDKAVQAAKKNPALSASAAHGGLTGSDSSGSFGLPRLGQEIIATALALASVGGAVVSLVVARRQHAAALGRKTPTKRTARK